MPASLVEELSAQNGPLEDQRALQIALELSMLGINSDDSIRNGDGLAFEDSAKLKSQNMTECVQVPSSEHVAEIVGRQGCKIKALRAKTNTYIKTPVRGEEPIFVVTGRKQDVGAAKREIISAADHFSQIRASRRNNNTGVGGMTSATPGPPSPSVPGQVTIQVRVPYRVVGLVVGPKGATIKRIQQSTFSYIVTPSRDKEPVFEVTGLPENVQRAKAEIEAHIAARTGSNGVAMGNNMNNLNGGLPAHQPRVDDLSSDFHTNGIDSSFGEEFLSGFPGGSSASAIKVPSAASAFCSYPFARGNGAGGYGNGVCGPAAAGLLEEETLGSAADPSSNMWGDFNSDDLMHLAAAPSVARGHRCSPPAEQLQAELTRRLQQQQHQKEQAADPLGLRAGLRGAFPETTTSASSSPTDSVGSLNNSRRCFVCGDCDVQAALVPCGHNSFCMDCANGIMRRGDLDRACPVCHVIPSQAYRIYAH